MGLVHMLTCITKLLHTCIIRYGWQQLQIKFGAGSASLEAWRHTMNYYVLSVGHCNALGNHFQIYNIIQPLPCLQPWFDIFLWCKCPWLHWVFLWCACLIILHNMTTWIWTQARHSWVEALEDFDQDKRGHTEVKQVQWVFIGVYWRDA